MTRKTVLKKILDSDMAFKPMKLTKAQQKEADLQLAEALKISRSKQTEEDILAANLLQLKFKLEDCMSCIDKMLYENSKGAAIFKKMHDDKIAVREHLKNGGKISDLKNQINFAKPISIMRKG